MASITDAGKEYEAPLFNTDLPFRISLHQQTTRTSGTDSFNVIIAIIRPYSATCSLVTMVSILALRPHQSMINLRNSSPFTMDLLPLTVSADLIVVSLEFLHCATSLTRLIPLLWRALLHWRLIMPYVATGESNDVFPAHVGLIVVSSTVQLGFSGMDGVACDRVELLCTA